MQDIKRSYIDQLTWLRGLAAFLVIVSHSIRATEVSYYDGDAVANHGFFSALDLGTFGVLLFFALSGCTLFISNGHKLKSTAIGGFYLKRILRIWPAFIVSMVFYFLFRFVFQAFYPFEEGFWIEGQFLNELTYSDILEQALLFSNFTNANLLNNAYWSLPVEFQYYLIFPLLVLSTRYIGLFGPVVIGVVFYMLPKFVPISTSQVFTLALSFCGGVGIGYIYSKNFFSLSQSVGGLAILGCFALVSLQQLSVFSLPEQVFISNVWNFYSVVAILMVAIVLHTKFDIPRFIAFALKKYGDVSYSTYLYHNLVIGALMLVFLEGAIDGTPRFYLLLALTLVITQVISFYSHRYVEVPAIRLARKKADKVK